MPMSIEVLVIFFLGPAQRRLEVRVSPSVPVKIVFVSVVLVVRVPVAMRNLLMIMLVHVVLGEM